MATNPERRLDLFQKKALAQLATLMPDGSLQVSRVWVVGEIRVIRSSPNALMQWTNSCFPERA